MERVLSQDERIRRAEEIYARRQNLRERTKRATVNVSEPKNFRLLKRLALQIVICMLMYFIFYLVNTTNYSFSEEALEKTEELISEDIDFMSIYNNVINTVSGYITSLNTDLTEEDSTQEENMENEEINIVEEYETIETSSTDVITDLIEEETTAQEELEDVALSETDRIKQEYSFILPIIGTVTSEFGTRESTSSIVSTYHKGIDIAAVEGTSIVASTSGTVITAKYNSSYGNYIIIEEGEVKTVYAHCSELLASVRRYYNARARNCKGSAQLGNATGPHLHFEIRINDSYVNPREILEF